MKLRTAGIVCAGIVTLLSPFSVTASGRSARVEQGHASTFNVRIALPDGSTRTAKLDGVGCSISICSRVAITGIGEGGAQVRRRLDGISSIQKSGPNAVLLVLKDGTEQKLSLVRDFRVLYVTNSSGGTEKLDLMTIRSIELLSF